MSSLTVLVDGVPAGDNQPRYFYSGQIVTVQGILVLDSGQIKNGDTLTFSNIGMHLGNVLPYSGYNVGSYDLVHETLTVDVDPESGVATFKVVVMGMDNGVINASYKELVYAKPYVVGAKRTDVCAPIPPRQWLTMPAKGEVVVPSSGEYIHYRFEVWDRTAGTSLKNMRVKIMSLMLFPDAANELYDAFNFYASYDDLGPIPESIPLPGESTQPFVELVTDDEGYAEVFVCGKYVENIQHNPTSKIISLTWNVGISGNTSLGWTMVLTFQPSAALSAPQPPAGDVDLSGPITAEATIGWYEGASNYDHVFLFCNGEYQSDATIIVDGVLQGQPLAKLPFLKYGLHSKDAQYRDPAKNVLQYVLLFSGTGQVLCSPSGAFYAKGMPPSARPQVIPPDVQAVPAPLQWGSGYLPHGWPINSPGRLFQVCVPLDNPSLMGVADGDTIDVEVYLNGHRPWQDGYDEPRARIVQGPAAYCVTPRMLKKGVFVLDFNGEDFSGFGPKATTGEMGSLEVQYSVARAGSPFRQQLYITYLSAPLRLPLDNVAPCGVDSLLGNYRTSSQTGSRQADNDNVEVTV